MEDVTIAPEAEPAEMALALAFLRTRVDALGRRLRARDAEIEALRGELEAERGKGLVDIILGRRPAWT